MFYFTCDRSFTTFFCPSGPATAGPAAPAPGFCPLVCRPASVLIRLNPVGNIGNDSVGSSARPAGCRVDAGPDQSGSRTGGSRGRPRLIPEPIFSEISRRASVAGRQTTARRPRASDQRRTLVGQKTLLHPTVRDYASPPRSH